MKKERGITLVALIITTIVLVILSAISIKAIFEINFIDVAVNSTINYAGAQANELDEYEKLENSLANTIEKLQPNDGNNQESIDSIIKVSTVKESESSFTLIVTAKEDYDLSNIEKYDIYVDNNLMTTIENPKEYNTSYTVKGVKTGDTECYVMIKYKNGKEEKHEIIGKTKLYTWETWDVGIVYKYTPKQSTTTVYRNKSGYIATATNLKWNNVRWEWEGALSSYDVSQTPKRGLSIHIEGSRNNWTAVWITVNNVSNMSDR
ncbi:MAG: hypothetical protein HFJ50_02525 [Clostridia bacterium]|jgi:type II secretory pathway pseudopilin PulG|nr:hypothetical protein [Clostridia bacterium]